MFVMASAGRDESYTIVASRACRTLRHSGQSQVNTFAVSKLGVTAFHSAGGFGQFVGEAIGDARLFEKRAAPGQLRH